MPLLWTHLILDRTGWTLGCCSDSKASLLPVSPPEEPPLPVPEVEPEVVTEGPLNPEVRVPSNHSADHGQDRNRRLDSASNDFWRDPENLEALVDAALRAARDSGARPVPLILALPSSACLAATVSTDGLLRQRRREALSYRLEEALPLDAENYVADFAPAGSTSEALGVAVEVDPLRLLIEALEARGLTIAHVCPTALLLHVACPLESSPLPPPDVSLASSSPPECDAVAQDGTADVAPDPPEGSPASTTTFPSTRLVTLIGCGVRGMSLDGDRLNRNAARDFSGQASMDLVVSEAGQIRQWRHLPRADLDQVVVEIAATTDRPGSESCIWLGNIPTALEGHLTESFGDKVGVLSLTHEKAYWHTALITSAQRAARGGGFPIDLRRDRLADRHPLARLGNALPAAAAGFLLLLLATASLGFASATRWSEMAQSHEAVMIDAFTRVFPNQPTSAATLSRLRSEATKAEGLRGDLDAPEAVASTRLLHDLHDLLTATRATPGLRFQLLELRLDADRFYLDGHARSHAEADRFVQQLSEELDYELDPPRSQSVSSRTGTGSRSQAGSGGGAGFGGGVAFTVNGIRAEDRP